MIAVCAGAVSLAAPPAALLGLGVLAAYVLVRQEQRRVDWMALAGPAFAFALVGAFVGLAAAIGLAFAWRLFVDAKWSVGEAQRLALAAGRPGENTVAAMAHAWLTPAYGLALAAYTSPHMVAGLPLDLPHLPALAPLAVGFAATAAVFDWALRRAADWRLGELAAAPAAHLACHHALFVIAFGAMLDLSAGLVALLAWRLAHAAAMPRAASEGTESVPSGKSRSTILN